MSWLLSSITEQMLGRVWCNTSAEIWKVLDQLFSTRSIARILQLRFSLQTTRKGAEFVEEYILKIQQAVTSFICLVPNVVIERNTHLRGLLLHLCNLLHNLGLCNKKRRIHKFNINLFLLEILNHKQIK